MTSSTKHVVSRPADRGALIGRSDELRHIQSVVSRPTAANVHVMVIEGAAGIGKTRLVNDALGSAGESAVLRCRCQQHNPPPFLPFIRLLRQVQRLSHIDEHAREQAAHGLRLLTGDIDSPDREHSADRFRSQLFLAVADSLRAVRSVTDIVMVIDDAHWLDPASESLLDFVLDDLSDDPDGGAVALIVSARIDGRGGTAGWSPSPVQKPHQSSKVRLRPLSATEVLDLVLSLGLHAPDPEWLAAVTTASAGNPMLVIEETRRRIEKGDADIAMVGQVDTIVEDRLAALDPEAQIIIRSCSLLDVTFSHEEVDALSGRPRGEVDRALVEGVRHGLLVRASNRYSFAHDLWQSYLHGQLSSEHRQRAHDRIATAAIDSQRHDPTQVASIGRHLRNGQRLDSAVVAEWCERAGDVAWSSTAWHEATENFQAALVAAHSRNDQATVWRLQAKAAKSHVCNAEASAAQALYRDLASSAREAGNVENWAIGVSGEARVLTAFSTDGLHGNVPTEGLRDFLRHVDEPRHRALVLTHWANIETTAGNASRGAQLATDAIIAATSADADRSAALLAAGYAYLVDLDTQQAVDHLRACELARRGGHDWEWAESLSRLTWAHLLEGDLQLAITTGHHAIEVATRAGHFSDVALAETAMAAAYLALGNFDDAQMTAEAALRHAYRTTYQAAPHLLFPVLVEAHRLWGRGEDADAVLELWQHKGAAGRRAHAALVAADLAPSSSDNVHVRCPSKATLGSLGRLSVAAELVGLGKNLAATNDLQAMLAGLDQVAFTSTGQCVARLRSIVEAATGDHEQALASVDVAIALCERVAARGELAQAHLLRAVLVQDPDQQRTSGALGRSLAEEVGLAPHRRSSILADFALHEDEHERAELTILFSDLAGSTALSVEHGDAALVRAIEQSRSILRARCEAFNGNEFGTEGDGYLAWFDSARDAVACAEAVLEDLRGPHIELQVGVGLKIGIATGRPVLHDGDVFGKTVNLAARLSDRAGTNELIIDTRSVALASGDYRFAAEDLVTFKGFPEPQPVFSLIGRRTSVGTHSPH